MLRGPGRLKELFNALRDFVVMERAEPGPGLVVHETVRGRQFRVIDTLLNLAKAYEESQSVPGNTTNIFNTINRGGGGGQGLPGTTTDGNGEPADPNGNTLGWQTINVCVFDGEGYTPMKLGVYGSLY